MKNNTYSEGVVTEEKVRLYASFPARLAKFAAVASLGAAAGINLPLGDGLRDQCDVRRYELESELIAWEQWGRNIAEELPAREQLAARASFPTSYTSEALSR